MNTMEILEKLLREKTQKEPSSEEIKYFDSEQNEGEVPRKKLFSCSFFNF